MQDLHEDTDPQRLTLALPSVVLDAVFAGAGRTILFRARGIENSIRFAGGAGVADSVTCVTAVGRSHQARKDGHAGDCDGGDNAPLDERSAGGIDWR